jgi:hypothetical protein
METQKRVARENLDYAGKILKPGQEFECEVEHVEVLLAFGKIEPKKGEHGYKTRHMTARGE